MTHDQQHPITAPPDLLKQWALQATQALPEDERIETDIVRDRMIAARAAQWGADQELEACIEWLKSGGWDGCGYEYEELFAARRPKPPSLKEQALKALENAPGPVSALDIEQRALIRRALEALPDD